MFGDCLVSTMSQEVRLSCAVMTSSFLNSDALSLLTEARDTQLCYPLSRGSYLSIQPCREQDMCMATVELGWLKVDTGLWVKLNPSIIPGFAQAPM